MKRKPAVLVFRPSEIARKGVVATSDRPFGRFGSFGIEATKSKAPRKRRRVKAKPDTE
jgi:hypothetical protein